MDDLTVKYLDIFCTKFLHLLYLERALLSVTV